jgi:hypothetical protein
MLYYNTPQKLQNNRPLTRVMFYLHVNVFLACLVITIAAEHNYHCMQIFMACPWKEDLFVSVTRMASYDFNQLCHNMLPAQHVI